MKFKKLILLLMGLLLSAQIIQAQEGKDIKEVNGLEVGTVAPLFTAQDANQKTFNLSEAIEQGPVVLIFYRGFWCPVCNKHLSKLQDSLKFIQAAGARVIAISPEKPEYLGQMAEQTGAEFTLLYDEDYKIAQAYDVSFKPSSLQLFTYNKILGAKLKSTHSDESQRLPIPATYVLASDGIIHWRQFDRNYKNRSRVHDIIRAIEKIQ
jgi:peroxiredoxin